MSESGIYKCSCEHCGEHLEYPAEYEGMEFACPHCGKGTHLQQSAASQASAPSAPPMGSASGSGGRATAAPPQRKPANPDPDDPMAGAVPHDLQQSAQAAAEGEPDPNECENCGSWMDPNDKVCVDCGHRRSSVKEWNFTAVFRLVAGIVLFLELVVMGLQWTTTVEPFGLRQYQRHAVLVKLGLREEVDPAEAALANLPAGTNAPAALVPVVRDPDLVLAKHELMPDKDNGALYIHGTVKNVSKYRYLAIRVSFQLKDRSGATIPDAVTSAYVQSIEPGQEWNFKALVLDPDATGYDPIKPVEGYR